MQLGVTFPEREIGTDPAVIRNYAQAAEDLGYDFIVAPDHVLGADRSYHKDLLGPYTHHSAIHEPFTLFAYLAGVTKRIALMTNVIILPQRQTVLVAKQAAEVDLLSGGRLILGVGNGWNPVEYEGLGMNFHRRGARMEEQLRLLRALLEQDIVTFEGRFDRVTHAGINPRPSRRIPIWMGGMASRVLDRIGRLADGWAPRLLWDDDLERATDDMLRRRERIANAARAAGRDPSEIGLLLAAESGTLEEQLARARRWEALGATHCRVGTQDDESYRTPGAGKSPSEHIAAIRAFRESFGAR